MTSAIGSVRSRIRILLMSENPKIEIDLIYQLLRMAEIAAKKRV